MKRLICLPALVALALPLAALAQASKESKAKPAEASVNWEGQILKATGSGAPDMKASSPAQARLGAETAAKMDAFRNLLSQAKGIQITAGKTVGESMERDEIRGKVEGAIRGYKITSRRYFSDQGVELDVEVPLAALTAAIDPPPAAGAAAETEKAIVLKTDGEKTNTGLVVDARGLEVTPALSPRLLDQGGHPVYAVDVLSDDARKSKGVASYYQSLDAAKKAALVGDKPLVVKATKAQGSDLVLGADDLKKLSETNNSYLAEGRVAIVTK